MTGLALGCSHTVGVGIEPSVRYSAVLGQMLGVDIKNLGVPGSSADSVFATLVRELPRSQFEFVIAQWPNPVRRIIWHRDGAHHETIHNSSPAFNQLLKQSDQNFYQPWLQNIIVANMLCKLYNTRCVNIIIEDVDPVYHTALAEHNIRLHSDRKTPGETWLMDSGASDNLHHSADCHRQWAERLFGLLNEPTTP